MKKKPARITPLSSSILLLIAGCASNAQRSTPAVNSSSVGASAEQATPAPQTDNSPSSDAPRDTDIAELMPSDDVLVRVRGVVSKMLGMRLVPAKVIFKVDDATGSVTVVINEQASLTEGQKLELVGRYQIIPSPMHTGPDEAPEEPALIVERFLQLP